MSARNASQTQTLASTPRITPRLPLEDAIPSVHRAVVYQALARVDYAVRELDSILRTYAPTDARVFDLRHAATRLDMALHNGHSWLVCHPALEDRLEDQP